MSYVPKYIIKRMIRKNALKKVEGGLEFTFTNIISPIEISIVPDNFLDYIKPTMDRKPISKDIINNSEVTVGDETFYIKDAQKYIGRIIPVGAELLIKVPGLEVEQGKECEFEFVVEETSLNFKVKRTIQ